MDRVRQGVAIAGAGILQRINSTKLIEREFKCGSKMFQKIMDFGKGTVFQYFPCLFFGGQKFIISCSSFLNALEISTQLVGGLNKIVRSVFRFSADKRSKGSTDFFRERLQKPVAGELFNLFIGIFDFNTVVFDRSRQIPGEDFGTVMVQRYGSTLFRVACNAVYIPAYHAKGMGNHSDHVAVFLNVFRQSIAHKAPSSDVAHAGNIGKKIITHFGLLFSNIPIIIVAFRLFKC